MKAVIAIDSFKGCLSSAEAAAAVAEGLVGHDCVVLPVSDGGEGFATVLTEALGGELVTARVHDPLGRMIDASYGLAGQTAVIESAAASGLTLMSPEELNPLRASSRGTGELIADAICRGARDIYVGFGGTGTNDGGKGMLEAMETVRVLWPECRFTGLCDVTATFCGPEGATAVYGPQKGVKPEQVALLDDRLRALAEQYRPAMGRDVLTKPGSGAAGGMAGALWAVLGGELKPGADAVLDILRFEHHLKGASLVITGEGRIDAQTLQGKLPTVVARRAKAFSPTLRVVAFTGRNELTSSQSIFDEIIQITPDDVSLETALDRDYAYGRLTAASARFR
ncbi:MAG: glycerate kinase [Bacteroidales bacterium]|nr:glycerate kinase [Bacteroidales bacterium]